MRVQFSKWGNSVALRVPAAALRDLGAAVGTQADLTIDDGKLVVTPVPDTPAYSFDELLAGITEDNIHEDYFGETSFGSEAW